MTGASARGDPPTSYAAPPVQRNSPPHDGDLPGNPPAPIPELLAPAGNFAALVAAVQAGADAVYLGTGDFNARRNAENFEDGLEGAASYCQARKVRLYVTLNTMVRQEELPRLEATIGEICAAGADGVIVQDIGTARALRQMAPTLPLHASTQMAVHNPQGVRFLAQQGFRRAVLARELDFGEIAHCCGLGAEIEVFVHGALCSGVSGLCLLSSLIGGRSGNRGLCAQPCRQRYALDGKEACLLSMRDLCSLEELAALRDAGVAGLKIEGRLKRPEYVALTTAVYRAALDALACGAPFDFAAARRELLQMYNRGGFTRGYGPGTEEAKLLFPERPNHLGLEVGRCGRDGEMRLEASIDARDALALRRSLNAPDAPVRLPGSAAGIIPLPEAKRGDTLIRLSSQTQLQALQTGFSGERRKFPVDAVLTLHIGEPACLALDDGEREVNVAGERVQPAQTRPAEEARLRAQIAKLGDTPFALRGWRAELDADAFLPVSALNALRRQAVEALLEARRHPAHPCGPLEAPPGSFPPEQKPELIAQSGDPAILRRALAAGADFAAFAPRDLRPQALAAALPLLPPRFDLVLPPVMGAATLRELLAWARGNAPRLRRVLRSNIGQFGLLWPGEAAGDFELNIANRLSVAQLAAWGVRRYTPSVELNRAQIEALDGERELIVYGRLPLMQLRHCPLRTARGMRGPHRNCRRCDGCAPGEDIGGKALTDRLGARFPLRRIASAEGCVVQLLNSATLMLLRHADSLPAAVGWRLLLGEEDPVKAVVRLHRLTLEGQDPRRDAAWEQIDALHTTTGHYFRGVD